jgi:hypothetical protein
MPVPGYDLEDLDRLLKRRLGDRPLEEVLSAEEFRRYESGESLVDALDEETITRLLKPAD